MRVAFEYLKRLVARNASDLHRIKTLLKKAIGGFMPKIVKMKSGDPLFLTSFGEVLRNRIQSDIPCFPVDPSGTQSIL